MFGNILTKLTVAAHSKEYASVKALPIKGPRLHLNSIKKKKHLNTVIKFVSIP